MAIHVHINVKDAGFNESDHPRSENGQFGSGGGKGGSSGKRERFSASGNSGKQHGDLYRSPDGHIYKGDISEVVKSAKGSTALAKKLNSMAYKQHIEREKSGQKHPDFEAASAPQKAKPPVSKESEHKVDPELQAKIDRMDRQQSAISSRYHDPVSAHRLENAFNEANKGR